MDLRNVIFAIALSFAVLFGWSVIFETPEIEKQKIAQQTEGNKNQEMHVGILEEIRHNNTSSKTAVIREGNKRTNISFCNLVVLERKQ